MLQFRGTFDRRHDGSWFIFQSCSKHNDDHTGCLKPAALNVAETCLGSAVILDPSWNPLLRQHHEHFSRERPRAVIRHEHRPVRLHGHVGRDDLA